MYRKLDKVKTVFSKAATEWRDDKRMEWPRAYVTTPSRSNSLSSILGYFVDTGVVGDGNRRTKPKSVESA